MEKACGCAQAIGTHKCLAKIKHGAEPNVYYIGLNVFNGLWHLLTLMLLRNRVNVCLKKTICCTYLQILWKNMSISVWHWWVTLKIRTGSNSSSYHTHQCLVRNYRVLQNWHAKRKASSAGKKYEVVGLAMRGDAKKISYRLSCNRNCKRF